MKLIKNIIYSHKKHVFSSFMKIDEYNLEK